MDATLSLTGNGEILNAIVAKGGYGYTTATIVLDGDYDTQATLIPTIHSGCDRVVVIHGGSAGAFTINSTDIWEEVRDAYGVEQVLQYKQTTISGGTGGILSYYITKFGALATDSKKDYMIWISKEGTGYSAPTAIIGDVVALRPTISLQCTRKISAVTISAAGTGYNKNTVATVIGDGFGAEVDLIIDEDGGISSVTLLATANTNKGFLTTPIITVEDTAANLIGSITKIKILNPGKGFRQFPILKCEISETYTVSEGGSILTKVRAIPGRNVPPAGFPEYGTGAKLIAVSNSIGGVKKISQTKFGYGYEETPLVAFPVAVLVDDTRGFRLNEAISTSGAATSDISSSIVSLMTNQTNFVVFYFNKPPADAGVFPGQKLQISGSHSDVNGGYVINATNEFTYTAVGVFEKVCTTNTTHTFAGTASLIKKSGKIIKIDEDRNIIYIDNVDNIFECS